MGHSIQLVNFGHPSLNRWMIDVNDERKRIRKICESSARGYIYIYIYIYI